MPGQWEGRWCSGTRWRCRAEPAVLRGRGWSANGSCWCCLPGVQPLCPEQEQSQLHPGAPQQRLGVGCQKEHGAGRGCPVLCWVNLGLHTRLSLSPCPYPRGCVPPFSLAPRALCLLDLGAFLRLCQGWSCWIPPLHPAATTAFVAQSTVTKLMLPSCVPPHL